MKCPYCEGSEFYEGPSGGLSTNILCANPSCRHWFNSNPLTGLEDLNRIEPSKKEKEETKTNFVKTQKLEYEARLKIGEEAFNQGLDPETLRTSQSYGYYAEASANIDKLVGYIRDWTWRI